jgi:hypothetical protein
MRLTVFRCLLAVAIVGILLHLADGWLGGRRERYLMIADWHARQESAYRKNAQGSAIMLRVAAWHEFRRREFERAAARPWRPFPSSPPHPPPGWTPPATPEADGR